MVWMVLRKAAPEEVSSVFPTILIPATRAPPGRQDKQGRVSLQASGQRSVAQVDDRNPKPPEGRARLQGSTGTPEHGHAEAAGDRQTCRISGPAASC